MNNHPWNLFLKNIENVLLDLKPAESHDPSLRRDDKKLSFICTNSIKWGGSEDSLLGTLKPYHFVKNIENNNKALQINLNYEDVAEALFDFYKNEKNILSNKTSSEKWMVEYSQPNTHKAFHIGHFRNVVTGDFIVKISRIFGVDVISTNYIGDIGTHVLKALLGWEKRGKPEPPKKGDLSSWLGGFYSEWAQKESESKEKFLKNIWENKEKINKLGEFEIKDNFKKLKKNKFLINKIFQHFKQGEFKGEDLRELVSSAESWEKDINSQNEIAQRWKEKNEILVKDWEKTKEWCLEAFDEIYKLLEIEFEKIYYESELEEEAVRISKELVKKGLAKEEKGSVFVDFKKEPYNEPGLDVLPLLRSDGLPLYSAKDLALAQLKKNQYETDKSFYVVGAPQGFYFKQVFKILEKNGDSSKLTHIGYEMVDLPEGKMSSRSGNIVAFSELWNQAKNFVKSKSSDKLSSKDLDKIVIGALKHLMFSRDFNKKISFKWDEVLSNEGKTGSYLQYAAVRCKRVLEKSDKKPNLQYSPTDMNKEEKALLFQLFTIQNELKRSFESISPTPLLEALHRLAKSFSNFYHSSPIINENKKTENFRLNLTYCTLETLEKSLKVFGISVPEKM